MVKGYDPTKSDFSSLLWNHLFGFYRQQQKIELQEANSLIRKWIKSAKNTSLIYNKFKQLKIRPNIKLVDFCNLPTSSNDKQPDINFPTKSSPQQIVICLDKITNKLQLKQNLDRELHYLYLHTKSSEKDEIQMQNLYKSCYEGYRNYLLDQNISKQMSIICSKYLFFKKTQNNMPMDRLFRYTSQLIDQIQK